MKKILVLPIAFTLLATLGCLWPMRKGPARATEIAYGRMLGATEGVATQNARMTQEALFPETMGTPEPGVTPTCSPSLLNMNCMGETMRAPSAYTGVGSPTPIPTPAGEVLFTTTTKGSGPWTQNNLLVEPGGSSYAFGTDFSSGSTAQLTHGVTIPVYETYLVENYYLVVVEGWVELRDLANAGQDAYDTTRCVDHSNDHQNDRSICHAHLYSSSQASTQNLIGLIEQDLTLQVTEVNEEARMAKVTLPPLWIEADDTAKD